MAILRACRRAIAPGGALLVIERIIAPPNEGADAKFSDLNMLVLPGGRERTLRRVRRHCSPLPAIRLARSGRDRHKDEHGGGRTNRARGGRRAVSRGGLGADGRHRNGCHRTPLAAMRRGVLLFPPLIPVAMLALGAALQWLAPLGWSIQLGPWRFGIGIILALGRAGRLVPGRARRCDGAARMSAPRCRRFPSRPTASSPGPATPSMSVASRFRPASLSRSDLTGRCCCIRSACCCSSRRGAARGALSHPQIRRSIPVLSGQGAALSVTGSPALDEVTSALYAVCVTVGLPGSRMPYRFSAAD